MRLGFDQPQEFFNGVSAGLGALPCQLVSDLLQGGVRRYGYAMHPPQPAYLPIQIVRFD